MNYVPVTGMQLWFSGAGSHLPYLLHAAITGDEG